MNITELTSLTSVTTGPGQEDGSVNILTPVGHPLEQFPTPVTSSLHQLQPGFMRQVLQSGWLPHTNVVTTEHTCHGGVRMLCILTVQLAVLS